MTGHPGRGRGHLLDRGHDVAGLGITRPADQGWGDGLTTTALVLGVALLVCFVVNEWRVGQPIMPLRLFADREPTGAYAAPILYLGAMLGFWFFVTQFLQAVYHYPPLAAGMAFLPCRSSTSSSPSRCRS